MYLSIYLNKVDIHRVGLGDLGHGLSALNEAVSCFNCKIKMGYKINII